MELSRENILSKYIINSYSAPGIITINQQKYQNSLILTPENLIDSWKVSAQTAIKFADLAPLLALNPEVIILAWPQAPGPQEWQLLALIQAQGIGCELMEIQAACRTFNIMASDGRKVALGVIL